MSNDNLLNSIIAETSEEVFEQAGGYNFTDMLAARLDAYWREQRVGAVVLSRLELSWLLDGYARSRLSQSNPGRARKFTDDERSQPWDGQWRDDDRCSTCGELGWDKDGYLIYITVLAHPGEEGYVEVTQALCQEHYEAIASVLVALGFKSHNHHGTNLLDADDSEVPCGGYGKCPTPAEYGPELVRHADVLILEAVTTSEPDEYVLLEGDELPYHLQPDALGVSCDACGRTSWTPSEWGDRCDFPQPDGSMCRGVFKKLS